MRTAIACAVLGVLAIAGAFIGFEATHAIMSWKVIELFPSNAELIVRDPSEPRAMQIRFAIAFAWPAIVVAVSTLLYRLRAHREPPWRTIGVHVAIAAALFALVMLVPTLLMGRADFPNNVRPMILISDLAPGASELEAGIALVLGLVAHAWFAAGAAKRAADRAGPT